MTCSNCGAQVNRGARFCTGCGQSLDTAPRKMPRATNWALVLGALAVAVVAVLAILAANGRGLPFQKHSADTNHDGIVSQQELQNEIDAMPRFKAGPWTTSMQEFGSNIRDLPENHFEVLEGDVKHLIIYDVFTNLIDYGHGSIINIRDGCTITNADLISNDFSILFSCQNGPVSGNISVTGTKDDSHIYTRVSGISPKSSGNKNEVSTVIINSKHD